MLCVILNGDSFYSQQNGVGASTYDSICQKKKLIVLCLNKLLIKLMKYMNLIASDNSKLTGICKQMLDFFSLTS